MAKRKFDFNTVRKQMEMKKNEIKIKKAITTTTIEEKKRELARLKEIQNRKRREEENLRLHKRAKEKNMSVADVLKELKKNDANATSIDAMKIIRGPVESAKLKSKGELGNLAKRILDHTTKETISNKPSRAFKQLIGQLDTANERMHARNERINVARQRQRLQLEIDKLTLAEEKAEISQKKKQLAELEKRKAKLANLRNKLETPLEKAKKRMESADLMLKYNANTPEEARSRQAQEKKLRSLQSKKEFYEKKARRTGEQKLLTGKIEARVDYYTDKQGQQRKGMIYVSPGGTKIDEFNVLHKKITRLNDLSLNVKQTYRAINLKRKLVENPTTGKVNVIAIIENPEVIHPKSLATLEKNAMAAGLKIIHKKKHIEIVG